MRYLFITWDGGGNLHAVLPLAERLVGRGHEIVFLGHRSQEAAIKTAGCGFAGYERAPGTAPSSSDRATINDWAARSRLHQAAIYRDNLLFGPASAIAADVLAAVDRFQPDAVAVDYMLLGAIAAAERSGLPAAAVWHCVYAPPHLEVPVQGSGRGLPRGALGRLQLRVERTLVNAWWDRSLPSLNSTRASLALPPLTGIGEQLDRLDRTLVASSAALDFASLSGTALPANLRYIGPQIGTPPAACRDGAEEDGEQPLVLVSFSTTYQAQQALLERAIGALGTLPVRALVTTGPAVSIEGPLPANVEVRSWASHSEVLPQASLVLTHGGHGTVMKSIAHGVPAVCIPMGRDQPCVAARIVHSGCGLRLPSKPSARRIADAVRQALGDRGMRANAERLGQVLREEIAADAGVAEMEALASSRRAARPGIR
jgi:MGT family glycosyltransferase